MFIKVSLCGVLTLLSTTSAFALSCVNDYGGSNSCANNTQAAGDCTTLGYSTESVSGCEHYLYCPFNTAYKRCVKEKEVTIDCSDYPLSSCPTGAVCSACGTGSGSNIVIRYLVTACQAGYTKSGNTCVAAACSGYTLTSCPTNGSCSSCLSGTTTKYKLNSCADGYKISGSSCVAKTCSDYGYGYLTSSVCKNRHSVKLGASSGYCYSDCTACRNLGIYYNIVDFCETYGGGCYTSKNTSVSGYSYGTCAYYQRATCTISAARCLSTMPAL